MPGVFEPVILVTLSLPKINASNLLINAGKGKGKDKATEKPKEEDRAKEGNEENSVPEQEEVIEKRLKPWKKLDLPIAGEKY